MRGSWVIAWTVCAWLTVFSGCGAKSPRSEPASTARDAGGKTDPQIVKRIDKDSLPIGEYLPPLPGNVELAEPRGWKRERRKDYLAVLLESNSRQLPRILVVADPSPYEGIDEATEDNLPRLAEAIAQEVRADSLLELPHALLIGGRPYVRYVQKAHFKGAPCERQVLVTVMGGRRYQIDLEFMGRNIKDIKQAGYVVAATLRPASELPALTAPRPSPARDPQPRPTGDSSPGGSPASNGSAGDT